jgi:hypothetical protein
VTSPMPIGTGDHSVVASDLHPNALAQYQWSNSSGSW